MEHSKLVDTMYITDDHTGEIVRFKDNPTKYIEIVTGIKYKWYQRLSLWAFDKTLWIRMAIRRWLYK